MTCDCAIELLSGAPPVGGEVVAEYETVVDIDWRQEFVRQGAVDLNSNSATLVDEMGATWTTPASQANGSTSWGLTANGLEVVDCINAGNIPTSSPHTPELSVSLFDLAAAWGFDGDPTRGYIFETYVSLQENADDFQDCSGINIWKPDGSPDGAGYWVTQFGTGLYSAGDSVRAGRANAFAAFTQTFRTDLGSPPLLAVSIPGNGVLTTCFTAPWPGDWPDNDALRFVAGIRAYSGQQTDQQLVGDPPFFMFGLFHQANSTTQTYRAIHQRTRLLQI